MWSIEVMMVISTNYTGVEMETNQSTINRRKQAILNGLRMKLSNRNEVEDFLHEDSVR
jgi:hypothetical protein